MKWERFVDWGHHITERRKIEEPSHRTHEYLLSGDMSQVCKPTKLLYGPGRNALDIVGELTVILSYKQTSSPQQVFVVRGLKRNLLGLPAITALNLAARLDSTIDYKTLIEESFPSIFQGLGNLWEPYEIKLQPDAKPYALYTPRMCPYQGERRSEKDLLEKNQEEETKKRKTRFESLRAELESLKAEKRDFHKETDSLKQTRNKTQDVRKLRVSADNRFVSSSSTGYIRPYQPVHREAPT